MIQLYTNREKKNRDRERGGRPIETEGGGERWKRVRETGKQTKGVGEKVRKRQRQRMRDSERKRDGEKE